MTTTTALILIASLVSICISVANILMVRKMAKRNKALQEQLAQQQRSTMIQRSGVGRVWYEPKQYPTEDHPIGRG